jgi:catalase
MALEFSWLIALTPGRAAASALEWRKPGAASGGIAIVVAAVAGAFAYVHGNLDPQRLTPKALVDVLEKQRRASRVPP